MKINFENILKLLGSDDIFTINDFLNSNKDIFITKKFSIIITQLNDAFDGFKGRVVNPFEKSNAYYLKFEKKNQNTISEILDDNSPPELKGMNLNISIIKLVTDNFNLKDEGDYENINDISFNGTKDEILNQIKKDKLNSINIKDEIKNYVIKTNIPRDIEETPPYSLYITDKLYDDKLILKEKYIDFLYISDFNQDKVFGKNYFSLEYKTPLKLNKNQAINSFSDIINIQNEELSIFSELENIKDLKNLDKKKLKTITEKAYNKKIKHKTECKNENYNCCSCSSKLEFLGENYYNNSNSQMNFIIELIPIEKKTVEQKNSSSKIGYFLSKWSDNKDCIATIGNQRLNNQKIVIYKDGILDNSEFNLIGYKSKNNLWEKDETNQDNIIEKAILYWKTIFNKINSKYIIEESNEHPFLESTFRYINSITLIDNKFPVYGVASCALDPLNGNILLSNSTFNSSAHKINFDLETSSFNDKMIKVNYDLILNDHPLFNTKDNDFDSEKNKALREEIFYNTSDLKSKLDNCRNDKNIYINLMTKIIEHNLVKTIIHEMGHCLGLRHNFAGTTTEEGEGTNSIMDYVFYNNGKFTIFSSIKESGLYDLCAIEYGYTSSSIDQILEKNNKKILYVSDYAQIFYPTIGANDFENKINDNTNIANNFREAIVYWTWDEKKQDDDLKNNKDFINKKILYYDEKEYFELTYYYKFAKALNYRFEILVSFLYPFIYEEIDDKLSPGIIPISEQEKLLDILLDFYLKKDPFKKEASLLAKKNLLNLQSAADSDGDRIFSTLTHNMRVLEYYYAMAIPLYLIVGFERGMSPLDNYSTYFYNSENDDKDPYKVLIRKMILLIISCNTYLFQNNRWTFNYLESILSNNYNSKFLNLLGKYQDDIVKLIDNENEVNPITTIKTLGFLGAGAVFGYLAYKKKLNVLKYIANGFYLYLLRMIIRF